MHRCRSFLLVMAAATFAAACSDREPVFDADGSPPPAAAVKETNTVKPLRDPSVSPGNDFYQYAVGSWMNTTDIPYGNTSFGPLTELRTASAKMLFHEIAQPSSSSDPTHLRGLRTAYQAYMGDNANNADPLGGLRHQFAVLDTAENVEGLLILAARMDLGVVLPFELSVRPDISSNRGYALYIVQGPLGLENADAYDAPELAGQRSEYLAQLEATFTALGAGRPADRANQVFAFEQKLAAVALSERRLARPELDFQLVPAEFLTTVAANIPWTDIFESAGYGAVTHFALTNAELLEVIDELSGTETLETWRDVIKVKRISVFESALLGRTPLQSQSATIQSRQADIFAALDQYLRPEMSVAFANIAISETDLETAKNLIERLQTIAADRVENADWLTPASKRIAQNKLSSVRLKIGYPPPVVETPSPELYPDDPVGNHQRLRETYFSRQRAKLFGGDAMADWPNPPYVPALSYNPSRNEIVVPAALLQPAVFSATESSARNYGRLGVMVGHELWHAINDDGRYADAKGFYTDWWTASDQEAYGEVIAALRAQLPPDIEWRDEMLNETLGDIAGLSIAFYALQSHLDETGISSRARITANKTFFLSWAEVMRRVYTDAERRRRLALDSHALANERINRAVRNIDGWYDAFDVDPAADLYLPPQRRVQTW